VRSYAGVAIVIADDATGAMECGSRLAGLGADVGVTLAAGPPVEDAHECWVVDTESRHLPAVEARERVAAWVEFAGNAAIYKKTDSTLRGNIAAELSAFEGREVVYVGAYPAVGRSVRGGRLFVHGIPVEETEFAQDIRGPVRSGDLRALLGDRVEIPDAETEEDLQRIARGLAGRRCVLSGPAGFVSYFGHLAGLAGTVREWPAVSRWLVVCGSLHSASRRQAERAEALGFKVLRTPHGRGDPEIVAEELAREVAGWGADGVIVFGGDTAIAVWRELGIRELLPLPEVLPGVAVSMARDILFVTKAGGFGEDDVVEQAVERLGKR